MSDEASSSASLKKTGVVAEQPAGGGAAAPINLTNHFLIAMPGLEDEVFGKSVVYLCEHNENGALGLMINKPSDFQIKHLFEKVELPLGRQELAEQPVFQGGPMQTEHGFVLHDAMSDGVVAGEGLPLRATMSQPLRRKVAAEVERLIEEVLEAEASGAVGPMGTRAAARAMVMQDADLQIGGVVAGMRDSAAAVAVPVMLADQTEGERTPEQAAEAEQVEESAYASTLRIPGGGLEMTTSRDVLEAVASGAGPRRLLVSLGYASWGQGQLESELAENNWLTVNADTSIIFDTPVEQRYSRALSLLGIHEYMLSQQAGHA